MSTIIKIEKEELDSAIFAACQDAAEKLHGHSVRQRLSFALSVSESIMASVDQLHGKQERSLRASKAAKARHAANVPTDGAAATDKPKRVRRTKAQIAADNLAVAQSRALQGVAASQNGQQTARPVNNEELLPAPFGAAGKGSNGADENEQSEQRI